MYFGLLVIIQTQTSLMSRGLFTAHIVIVVKNTSVSTSSSMYSSVPVSYDSEPPCTTPGL